jgi:hypothetical protein
MEWNVSFNVMLSVKWKMNTSRLQTHCAYCTSARSILNFHKAFLKQLHERRPSEQHVNSATAIQHSEWREFMSSQMNTESNFTLNVPNDGLHIHNAMKYSSDAPCKKGVCAPSGSLSRAFHIDLYKLHCFSARPVLTAGFVPLLARIECGYLFIS